MIWFIIYKVVLYNIMIQNSQTYNLLILFILH